MNAQPDRTVFAGPDAPDPVLAVRGVGIVLPGLCGRAEIAAADLAAYAPPAGAWFDPEPFIGRRGHKYFTEAARLASAAIGLALADGGLDPHAASGDGLGIALGTNFAGHRVLAEIERATLEEGVAGLSPLTAPLFSINLSACLAGIRSRAAAFNVTLVDPAVAGLAAIVFARRALLAGYADRVLAGACEDEPAAPVANARDPSRSGACVLALEPAGPGEGGIVAAVGGRLTPAGRARLAARLAAAARGLRAADVAISATALDPDAREDLAALLADAVRAGGASPSRLASSTDAGGLGAVSPLVPLAQCAARGRNAVVAGASPYGAVHAIVLSRHGAPA